MDALTRIGQELGGPDWVQGPGGNVSVKEGDMLHVKASGKRLRDMGKPGSIATVPLADARAALEGDKEAEARTFARTPRPSLETYFHAIGAKVVIHTHAVGAMLVACSGAKRPSGVVEVPYERPGRGLGVRVAEALGGAREGTVLLASHGLVVYGERTEGAIARTREIDAAFRAEFADLEAFAPRVTAPYEVLRAEGLVLTTLPARKGHIGRFLFPDAAVFASVSRVPSLETAEARLSHAREALTAFGRPVVLVADDGARVHVARNEDELAQAREVLLAHDYVEDALLARGDGRYLPDDEPAKIVGMPSEQYRLSLTRSDSPC
ncbi:MAG: class II aldolase/adducin family protein [Myxococcales bacterium]|nr:class II aldolase/adducin family protein [Myxococcales bacterium]